MTLTSLRTHRLTVATAVVTGCLVVIPPSLAAADPPALNVTPCGSLLAHASMWPGTAATAWGEVHLVSDGYVSHLLRRPECTATGG